MPGNRVLRRTFRIKEKGSSMRMEKIHNKNLHNCTLHQILLELTDQVG
jgi:hypothetical protein